MTQEFKLEDPGEGIHEAEILNVFVSEGQTVSEGDPVLEIETDKASIEIPSPFDGTVESIKVQEGDQVRVGDVMMTYRLAEEAKRACPLVIQRQLLDYLIEDEKKHDRLMGNLEDFKRNIYPYA